MVESLFFVPQVQVAVVCSLKGFDIVGAVIIIVFAIAIIITIASSSSSSSPELVAFRQSLGKLQWTCECACMRACVHMCALSVCVCVCVCVFVRILERQCVSVCMRACLCLCTCLCMCAYVPVCGHLSCHFGFILFCRATYLVGPVALMRWVVLLWLAFAQQASAAKSTVELTARQRWLASALQQAEVGRNAQQWL